MKWLAATLLGLMLSSTAGANNSPPETLRVLVSSTWAMPLLEVQEEQVRAGIVHDMARAIALSLQMSTSFVLMPRARMDAAALAGDADLRCYVRSSWSSTPETYHWSGELFKVSNVLIGHASVASPQSLQQVPVMAVIGTTRAFSYSALEPGFQSGQWRREDAMDIEKLLLKLSLSRHPYAAVDVLSLDWFLRKTPLAAIAAWRLPLSEESIQCAVPKAGRVPVGLLMPAIEKLKSSGEMQRILQRYR